MGPTDPPAGSKSELPEAIETPANSSREDRRKAWLTLFGAFLLQMSSVGPVIAFGVFQDFYTSQWMKNYSASDISWIGSTQLFLDYGMGFIAGKLYDMGFGRLTLAGASVLYTFSFFMSSLVHPEQFYQAFLAQGLGMGICVGMILTPTLVLVSIHFQKRHRALAMGIVISSGALGSVIYSIMLNHLIESIGFAWAVRAAAFLGLGCFAIGNAVINVPRVHHDRDAGLPITNLLDWPYILTLLSGFVGQLGTYFPMFYIQLYADAHGLSKGLVFNSLAIMNVSGLFGRIIPNHFADVYGSIGTFIVCELFTGLTGLLMLAAYQPAGLIVFSIIYGFFVGSTISMYAPAVAMVAPRQADRGKSIGYAMVPAGVASLIGPPMIGAVMGREELAWWKGILFASIVLCASAGIQMLARHVHRQRLSTQAAT